MNIIKSILGLRKNLKINSIERNGFGIDAAITSALSFDSIKQGKAVFCREVNGFIDKNFDEFVKENFKDSIKILDGDMYKIYITKHSLIVIDSEWYTIPNEDSDLSSSVKAGIFSNSEDEIKIFDAAAKANIVDVKENTIYTLTQSEMGLRLNPIGSIESPIIKENYDESVMKDYHYIVDSFNSTSPRGRLVIINGEPGTGKTYLVKGLVNDLTNCTMVIIPSKIVSEIDGPSLIPLFVNHRRKKKKPITIIIEDADSCLAPRGSDNISSISSLLNNTDGILGAILDLRIVATTNQNKLEFDEALMRPGRLCKNVSINALNSEKANEVYSRLKGKEIKRYDKNVILAEIYDDVYNIEKEEAHENTKSDKTNRLGFFR